LSIAVASAAGAASIIGGGPPGPGLGGDDGSELYVPNLNPNYNRHIVLVKGSLRRGVDVDPAYLGLLLRG
jgi:hypothetical protein